MKCKFCGNELEIGANICHVCGKNVQEDKKENVDIKLDLAIKRVKFSSVYCMFISILLFVYSIKIRELYYIIIPLALVLAISAIVSIIKIKKRDNSEKPFIITLLVIFSFFELFSFIVLFNPAVYDFFGFLTLLIFSLMQVLILPPFIIYISYIRAIFNK
ncbi:hypothetical protein ACAG96_05415 [Candidatus Izemoplasma sp. B36]|uniref:hypothetical protein n=1 Tax=Candidatus Izemoplasma sp. B36 TaxID=3242468 RepID=UPI003558373C